MKDEIKEILDNIKNKYEDYYVQDIVSGNDLKLLLDYITNLQEENEEIKNTIDFIDNKYKNTINYNEKLIEYNQDYKTRIDKAIELLNDWNYLDKIDCYYEPTEVIEILQGKSDE